MILKLSAKCSDNCSVILVDESGKQIGEESDGYVPSFIPDGSDYIELDIDLKSGRILNWKEPAQEQLNETFNIEPK